MDRSRRRSHSPLFVQQNSTPPPDASPRRQRLQLPPLVPSIQDSRALNRDRSAYDYRRPVSTMGATNSTIIDLTEADDDSNTHAQHHTEPHASSSSRPQRLPRFDREIIDLSTDTSPTTAERSSLVNDEEQGIRTHPSSRRLPRSHMASHRGHSPTSLRREPSSDVVFVAEQPRSRPMTPAEVPQQNPDILDLTNDNDDDVVHVRTTGRAGLNINPPVGRAATRPLQMTREAFARLIGDAENFPGRIMQRLFNDPALAEEGERVRAHNHSGRARSHRVQVHARAFAAPSFLDYAGAGFDMGLGGIPAPPREATPRYDPPPMPERGFTRNPEPEEVVVCPACGDELATGESDEKSSVWIIKHCGHVSYKNSHFLVTSSNLFRCIADTACSTARSLLPDQKAQVRRAKEELTTLQRRSSSVNVLSMAVTAKRIVRAPFCRFSCNTDDALALIFLLLDCHQPLCAHGGYDDTIRKDMVMGKIARSFWYNWQIISEARGIRWINGKNCT